MAIVAARLFARRWLLYVLVCAVVLGLELLFVALVHVKFAWVYAQLAASPLVNLVVMVNAGSDAAGLLPTMRERLERILDRGWAIVLIDVGLTFVLQDGFAGLGPGDPLNIVMSVMVLFFGGMLVYAEPFACIEKETQFLTLVPFAILRSMMLAWVNMPRIFTLLLVQIVAGLPPLALQWWLPHDSYALNLIETAYLTVVEAPLAVLFTVAYLDTIAQERRFVS